MPPGAMKAPPRAQLTPHDAERTLSSLGDGLHAPCREARHMRPQAAIHTAEQGERDCRADAATA